MGNSPSRSPLPSPSNKKVSPNLKFNEKNISEDPGHGTPKSRKTLKELNEGGKPKLFDTFKLNPYPSRDKDADENVNNSRSPKRVADEPSLVAQNVGITVTIVDTTGKSLPAEKKSFRVTPERYSGSRRSSQTSTAPSLRVTSIGAFPDINQTTSINKKASFDMASTVNLSVVDSVDKSNHEIRKSISSDFFASLAISRDNSSLDCPELRVPKSFSRDDEEDIPKKVSPLVLKSRKTSVAILGRLSLSPTSSQSDECVFGVE